MVKSEDLSFHSLRAISPIDGRHRIMTEPLADWFSEYALHKYRVFVEVEYLISLSELDDFDAIRDLTRDEKDFLRSIASGFSLADAKVIQDIDRFGYNGQKPTNHDVKSVEYFIKMKLKGTSLDDVSEMVHFALTSEDINNIAIDCMVRGGMELNYIPALVGLVDKLAHLAESEKSSPMLSKTHGQPATPTTFGKEMANYVERLKNEVTTLAKMKLPAKLNGAVGNYNAHAFAAPEIDWIHFSEEFIRKLGFEPNLMTTQIEPHDGLCRMFSVLVSVNNILRDLSVDFWLYISQGYLVQQKLSHEVGSSTMPHKINPWRMEVAEGSAVEANAKLTGFIWKLQASRLQRDLSDHEAQRAIGVGIAHSYLAVLHVSEELGRVEVNREKMLSDLTPIGAILSEAVQTLLRRKGNEKPYEVMKDFSRGQNFSPEELYSFVDEMSIDYDSKEKIKSLRPETYIGYAVKLAEKSVQRWRSFRGNYEAPVSKKRKVVMDCDALNPALELELPAVSSLLSKKGISIVGINAGSGIASSFSKMIRPEEMGADREAVFVGVIGARFNEAKQKGMTCVNLEEVSRKKSEFNILRLSELVQLIDALNR